MEPDGQQDVPQAAPQRDHDQERKQHLGEGGQGVDHAHDDKIHAAAEHPGGQAQGQPGPERDGLGGEAD